MQCLMQDQVLQCDVAYIYLIFVRILILTKQNTYLILEVRPLEELRTTLVDFLVKSFRTLN